MNKINVNCKYKIAYPNEYNYKKHYGKIVVVIKIFYSGDCLVEFENGETDMYNFGWLDEIDG